MDRMEVRMLQSVKGRDDDAVETCAYTRGDVISLGPDLAAVFLREGWAELADKPAPAPAVAAPAAPVANKAARPPARKKAAKKAAEKPAARTRAKR